jgi:hypothetical protein
MTIDASKPIAVLLCAAVSFGDARWAVNSSIALFAAIILLGQLFLPRGAACEKHFPAPLG